MRAFQLINNSCGKSSLLYSCLYCFDHKLIVVERFDSSRVECYWMNLKLSIYTNMGFLSTTWQIAKLQENNRALDRLTKTKEAALLEAERTIEAAEAKASLVDDLQNRNQELLKRIEICQVLPAHWFLSE